MSKVCLDHASLGGTIEDIIEFNNSPHVKYVHAKYGYQETHTPLIIQQLIKGDIS